MGDCMHRRNMCSLTERLALNERMQQSLAHLSTSFSKLTERLALNERMQP